MNAALSQASSLFDANADAPARPPEGRERLRWEMRLGGALADKQFELFYQPMVQLRSGAIVGFEALIRWRHPLHGLVSPARFIRWWRISG